jgi:two-component system secretion response regulator SsrB
VNTVVVTDERPTAAFLYVLADERLNVVGQADSQLEVLPLVEKLDPDVVVLDLGMPGFDGLRCLRDVVALYPSVKVVVVSRSAERGAMSEAFQLGACGWVVQEGGGDELPGAIRAVLAGAAYENATAD